MPQLSETRLFVRNDDVGELTDALRHLVEKFIELQIPVSHQIIPARLTDGCARWLRQQWLENPGLIEFGQHGLEHRMVVRGRHLLREFGPERSLAEQARIVGQGRTRLVEMLGGDVPIAVFTPPQHKYDRNTIKAVAGSGYRIFSAAAYPSRQHRAAYRLGRALGWSSVRHHGISHHLRVRPEAPLYEISVGVVVDDGRAIRTRGKDLGREVRHAATRSTVVGLMFHHDVYHGQLEELDAIADAAVALGRERFALLSDLAPAPATG